MSQTLTRAFVQGTPYRSKEPRKTFFKGVKLKQGNAKNTSVSVPHAPFISVLSHCSS